MPTRDIRSTMDGVMKYDRLPLFLSALLLLSCAGAPSSPSSSESGSSRSEVSSSQGESSSGHVSSSASEERSSAASEEVSSEEGVSESASSEEASSTPVSDSSEDSSTEQSSPEELKGTKSIKEACLSLTGTPNEQGILVSDVEASLTAVPLTVIDSVATNKGYGESNRYKVLFADEEGTLVGAVDEALYLKLRDHVGKQDSVYSLTGVLSLYKGGAELLVKEGSYLAQTTMDYSPALAEIDTKTCAEIQKTIAELPLNNKGIGYGSPVKTSLTYVAELVDEVLLFTDGQQVIQVHGDSKISNGFTLGKAYELTVWESCHIYKPSLQFIEASSLPDSQIATLPQGVSLSGTDLYKVSYAKDKEDHSPAYESLFYTVRHFEGYVSYYLKDEAAYMVLCDSYSPTPYATYTSALQGKAIFVNNEDEKGLYYDRDFTYSALWEYACIDQKVSLDYVPYLYNTQKYWMGYCFLDTLHVEA